jgi:sigma-B regulation protein RsbU (phosphoserine phosphatase)
LQSQNNQPALPSSSGLPSGLRARLPTGLGGAVFWLGLWFCVLFLGHWVHGGFGTFLGILQFFVGIALACVALPLLWRVVRKHMLWSLRNKLVLTYLLIGLAPVILFVTLMSIFAYVAAGQFAIHLFDTRLLAELSQLSSENERRTDIVAQALQRNTTVPEITEFSTSALGNNERTSKIDSQRVKPHRETQAYIDGAPVALKPQPASSSGRAAKVPFGFPPWATELSAQQFSALVLDGNDLYLVAIHQQRWNDGRIFSLMTSSPVEGPILNAVVEGLGRASLMAESENKTFNGTKAPASGTAAQKVASAAPSRALRPRPVDTGTVAERAVIIGGIQPSPVNLADLTVHFTSTEPVVNWDTGGPDNVLVSVDSRPSLLYDQLFGASLSSQFTSYLRGALFIICLLFAIIELMALWMAIRLSRTITASVADLYSATQHIDRGDLNYRIGVTRNDQLAELSSSFNTMTGSLQRLLVEQKEKERLQSEISIAQEVQANLFPMQAPGIGKLDLHGVSRPARSVSGDYYDFLVFHKEAHDGMASRKEIGIGIAIGDISGKGISAALLMASLHSAVRAYRFASEELVYSESAVDGLLASREERAGEHDKFFQSPGRILSLLNRHLYRSTQPEKYATLFLAHYDAPSSRLTYSNAGQLPPLVLSQDGSIRRLDRGGTVVGLMDGMRYEEDSFHMQPGDILVAYSDGVTEPENDFGEFGEERLMEVVSRYRDQPLHVISTQVMAALDAWIGAEEQPDDITLVLARQS